MDSNNHEDMYVDMRDVIGDLVYEYGIPILSFDNLVALGQRVVIVYKLDHLARRITFDEICYYICEYIRTPFGRKVLEEIVKI